MLGHSRNSIGGLTGGETYARIVKENDRTLLRKSVSNYGVPVVQTAAEVLQEEERS